MILIGMLDSPYVRRVAISMKLMGLPFEHRSISVFRNFDLFRSIKPAVKAPSFICDKRHPPWIERTVGKEVEASRYPALVAYSARAEALPEFASTPLD